MPRGKFITLEGGEGAGKSTQARLLAGFLRGKGVDAVLTREVGGCPGAEAIRNLWLAAPEGHWQAATELLLIMAARREHITRVIEPALARGAWVVCDRFIDSSRVYQGVGLGLGIEKVDALYDLVAPGFMPDLTLLLDLPVEEGLHRMKTRGGQDDRYQQKDAAFHAKLRDAYLALVQKEPRFAVIDAAAAPETVAVRLSDAAAKRFGL